MDKIKQVHGQQLFYSSGQKVAYFLLGIAILYGIFLRLDAIDARILFLDESIHWSFIDALLAKGTYQYDPVYHGPFLYYIGKTFFQFLHRYDVFTLRLPIVLFSLAIIICCAFYKGFMNRLGMLITMTLVSTSCSLIYFSNLANYENYFVFFTTLCLLCFVKGLEHKNVWWFSAAIIVFSLMNCTKEAALITAAIVVASLIFSTIIYRGIYKPSVLLKHGEDFCIMVLQSSTYRSPSFKKNAVILLGGCGIAAVIFTLFYSSFGTNPQGIYDGLTSFLYWFNTGAESGHEKPLGYYLHLIATYDFAILFFGFIGILMTVCLRASFTKTFLGVFALFTLIFYSAIPYKTPWIIINMIVPLAIAGGLGITHLSEILSHKMAKAGIIFLAYCLIIPVTVLGIEAKYIHHSQEKLELTYVHTYDSYYKIINFLHSIASFLPQGKETLIGIVSPDYWPLPVYAWDFRTMSYYGGIRGRGVNLDTPILITDTKDNAELQELLLEENKNTFEKFITVPQRPGVTNTVYVDSQILQQYIRSSNSRILTNPKTNFRRSMVDFSQTYFPDKKGRV